MVIAFCWLIPPLLHSAADPFAQAGFVFPDWYVLFSYGYLRWGEYLPQFIIPAGPIGEFFGSPVISWNAAWWGAINRNTRRHTCLTTVPTRRRRCRRPSFRNCGAIYLHSMVHLGFLDQHFLECTPKTGSTIVGLTTCPTVEGSNHGLPRYSTPYHGS